MSWRPKDWERMKPAVVQSRMADNSFEAGADAMLEALRKEGNDVNISDGIRLFSGGQSFTLYHTEGTTSKGKLVFIPDEPEKKDYVFKGTYHWDKNRFYEQGLNATYEQWWYVFNHPATTVIEEGYFCPRCGRQIATNSNPAAHSWYGCSQTKRGISY